jgi:hypothetical protein
VPLRSRHLADGADMMRQKGLFCSLADTHERALSGQLVQGAPQDEGGARVEGLQIVPQLVASGVLLPCN